jgi:hypothetical protein
LRATVQNVPARRNLSRFIRVLRVPHLIKRYPA